MCNISIGKASAIRILVADELGLNPEFVPFAKMYMDPANYTKRNLEGLKRQEMKQTN